MPITDDHFSSSPAETPGPVSLAIRMDALLAFLGADDASGDSHPRPSTTQEPTTSILSAPHPLAKLLNLFPPSTHQGVANALFVKVNEAAAKAKAEAVDAAEAAAALALADIASSLPPHLQQLAASSIDKRPVPSSSKTSSYSVMMVPPEPICHSLRTPAAVHLPDEEDLKEETSADVQEEEGDGAKSSRRVSSRVPVPSRRIRGGWGEGEDDKTSDVKRATARGCDESDEEDMGRGKRGGGQGGRGLSAWQAKRQKNEGERVVR